VRAVVVYGRIVRCVSVMQIKCSRYSGVRMRMHVISVIKSASSSCVIQRVRPSKAVDVPAEIVRPFDPCLAASIPVEYAFMSASFTGANYD